MSHSLSRQEGICPFAPNAAARTAVWAPCRILKPLTSSDRAEFAGGPIGPVTGSETGQRPHAVIHLKGELCFICSAAQPQHADVSQGRPHHAGTTRCVNVHLFIFIIYKIYKIIQLEHILRPFATAVTIALPSHFMLHCACARAGVMAATA